jgi:hypothetical protein
VGVTEKKFYTILDTQISGGLTSGSVVRPCIKTSTMDIRTTIVSSSLAGLGGWVEPKKVVDYKVRVF